jgi:hypothetical protein
MISAFVTYTDQRQPMAAVQMGGTAFLNVPASRCD